jgi:hypothetical protein
VGAKTGTVISRIEGLKRSPSLPVTMACAIRKRYLASHAERRHFFAFTGCKMRASAAKSEKSSFGEHFSWGGPMFINRLRRVLQIIRDRSVATTQTAVAGLMRFRESFTAPKIS